MRKNLYFIRLFFAIISLILSALVIFGIFNKINILSIQFTPLAQRLLINYSVSAVLLFLGLIFLTFIFGRLYCSLICPLGIAQEIMFQVGKNIPAFPECFDRSRPRRRSRKRLCRCR